MPNIVAPDPWEIIRGFVEACEVHSFPNIPIQRPLASAKAALALREANPPSMPDIAVQGIQPTFVQVDQEILRSVVMALVTGFEYVHSARDEHEVKLGRTTRKNRLLGEMFDRDIKDIEAVRDKVRALLGWKAIQDSAKSETCVGCQRPVSECEGQYPLCVNRGA